jgi:hypothetical protein
MKLFVCLFLIIQTVLSGPLYAVPPVPAFEKGTDSITEGELKNNTGQSVEYRVFQGAPSSEIIDQLNENPDSELIQVQGSGKNFLQSSDNVLHAKIKVHTGPKNFPKNWWVNHSTELQTVWCFLRYAISASAFYVGLVSFSGFSLPTVIAGAQLAGLMSLIFMYKNIPLNNWLTVDKHWALRLVRYYLMTTFFIGVIKFGIIGSEVILTGAEFLNYEFIKNEFLGIAKAAFVGTVTQGFWGLWNAQYQERELKKIDPQFDSVEKKYLQDLVQVKSNFFSFVNSITNNSLSAIIATGGEMLILDFVTGMIATSGVVAFVKTYPRTLRCSQIL